MTQLALHELHTTLGAHFTTVNGWEAVEHYGDWLAEYTALRTSAGVIDLGLRSRLVLTGEDRVRLLNGQVTNNVKDLPVGSGCYAALVTNKGKMQSDLNVYVLPGELLLDFEPGLSAAISDRFNKFIIADDVQVIDAAPHYGLLSVQGPKSWDVVDQLGVGVTQPQKPFDSQSVKNEMLGEIYCTNQPRLGTSGFDLFVPTASLGVVFDKLLAGAKNVGGRAVGWRALEAARIEAGIPRFSVEMDETNLAPEAGIESRAISYAKGCYIGQEVIARIRTYGQVAKALRGLRIEGETLPQKGDKLFFGEKEVGYISSSVQSPTLNTVIGMGYVRREHNSVGTKLIAKSGGSNIVAEIVPTPFVK